MNFFQDWSHISVKDWMLAAVLLLILAFSGVQAQSIKDVRPAVLCVGEDVTVTGKDLNRVTRIDFNGVALYLSDGDFIVVNKSTLRFTAPAGSVTNGEELVTTIIYGGLFGTFPVDRDDNLMTINPLPDMPSNPSGSSYCEGDAVSSVSVNDPGAGLGIDWYDAPDGGTLLGSGNTFIPDSPGTFYAETVNLNTGCRSESRISASVTQIPAPSPPAGAQGSYYCEGEPVSQVSVDNPGNGFRVDWYNASTGGTFLFSGTTYSPTQPGTYYAETVNINNGCSSLTRTAATVNENPAPANATNPVDASFCGEGPVPSVRVDDPGNGFRIRWYTNATGNTIASGIVSGAHGEIFTPSNSVSASYYAEVVNTNSGCVSNGRVRVSVVKNPPYCTNTDISSFYFDEQNEPSEIDEINQRIQVVVPHGVSLTNLIAYFTVAPGAVAEVGGVVQKSGVTQNDFSNPLTYRITAADGITIQNWIVTVVSAPNEATQILTYGFPEQTGPAVIDRGNNIIRIEVGFMADVTALVARFTLSDGATATVNGIEQISGVTANDFSTEVVYTVTAQDQVSTANWRVRVTQQDIVDDENPVIDYESLPEEYPVGLDSLPATVAVSDNLGIRRVVMRYKRYQSTEWQEVRITSSDSLFTGYIKESIVGSHGMVYYFKAYDYKNNTDSTGIFNLVLRYDNQNSLSIPDLNFGGSIENYQIISLPVDLDEKNIDVIFDELMPYDIKRWRLFHYNNGMTNEFGQSLSTIYPSRGYWLIVRNQTDIHIGAGITNRIEDENGFAMTLQPGWNQVGNPYNFEISWDHVIDFNKNPNIGRIKKYENGILTETDRVPPFRGGFVFLSGVQSAFLTVPPNSGSGNARIAEKMNVALSNPINQTEWRLPIRVSSGNYSNSLFMLGMATDSDTGFDGNDEPLLPLPREISGFDFYFIREGETYERLNRDIVGPDEFQTWVLQLDHYQGSGTVTLQWNNDHFGENPYKLILLDEKSGRIIDMRASDRYTFLAQASHQFRIFYGTEDRLSKEIIPTELKIGEIYPNPFNNEIHIPVSLPDHNSPWQVDLSISDVNGKEIQNFSDLPVNPGYQQLSWKLDALDHHLRGFYFLKILLISENEKQIFYKKLVKY